MQKPQIWHYGLVAREWGEFETDGGLQAPYIKGIIENTGQPALDLGCGSGRLLIPYLQAGLDVDGCDYSKDMLAQCQERAKKEGLFPKLYEQAMHELDLPRRYKTIYACGVVGVGGERQLCAASARRCDDAIEQIACPMYALERDDRRDRVIPFLRFRVGRPIALHGASRSSVVRFRDRIQQRPYVIR